MNKFSKPIFLLTMGIAAILTAACFFYWNSVNNEESDKPTGTIQSKENNKQIDSNYNNEVQSEEKTITVKRRINVVLLGIEGKARADTIMFISYDRTESKMSVISIPRDTYFYEAGYSRGDQRKINAVYGRAKEKGSVDAVSKVLCDTPVDYYISIDYEGVERIIDTIEGVEIEVPLDMEVGGIKITKGKQILHGSEALQYLRFRKKYKDGDLGRIKAQQRLIKSALSKVQYSNLPRVVNEAFNSIRTNMPLKYMNEYASQYKNAEVKDVSVYMLPGVPMYKYIGDYNWSYFFHNPEKVRELMNKIFEIESMEQKKRKRCELY